MKKTILLSIILFFASLNLYAQHSEDSTHTWHFRVSPYFWFLGFEGTIYRPPTPSTLPEIPPPEFDIDISFLELSSSLKFAMMLAGEYRSKHVVIIYNYSSLILEGEVVTPREFILEGSLVRLDFHAGDLNIGYRIIKSKRWELDALLGAKFIYFRVSGHTDLLGTITFEGERSKLWVDPVLAIRAAYRPLEKLEFGVYGDIGFLHTNQLSDQIIGSVSWRFTKIFLTTIGYRYWAFKADNEEAIYNGNVKGWIIRFGFQF